MISNVKEAVVGTILKVPHIEQTDEWPSGDECVCAVMLLRYLGIRISVNEFVDFFLPQGRMRRKEGKLEGCDPEVEFAGSPYEKNSFGCYQEVIAKSLNDCFAQKGLPYKAQDATGMSTDELLSESVGHGVPAIYWASEGMKPTRPGYSWTCRKTGETVQWTKGAQCMLLIGSDEGELVFNDPLLAEGAVHYSRKTSVKRHAEMGKRALIVRT